MQKEKMDIDFELETQHLFLIERTCVVCGKQKNLIADFYKCRPDATKISSYAYECKECTRDRVRENPSKSPSGSSGIPTGCTKNIPA